MIALMKGLPAVFGMIMIYTHVLNRPGLVVKSPVDK